MRIFGQVQTFSTTGSTETTLEICIQRRYSIFIECVQLHLSKIKEWKKLPTRFIFERQKHGPGPF